MKTFNFRKSISGIGLIEVLVTTVVIAVGLLAVASLQGNLIGSSRDNKTRAEAKALADAKIEQLRDTIVQANFNAITSKTTSTNPDDFKCLPAPNDDIYCEKISGITESFGRGWVITDRTSPTRKEISVTVNWPDGKGGTDNVVVQSVIAYDDVGNAAKNLKDAKSGSSLAGGPSTNAESSDEITETKTLPDGEPGSYVQDTDDENLIWIREDSRTKGTGAYLCSTLSLSAFENGLFTRRTNYDGVAGNEAIELYEQVTVDIGNYCIPRIRFNGGVIIPIRGIVHSRATAGNNKPYLDMSLFTFNASETGAYCIFKPSTSEDLTKAPQSAPYVCYVGGNCTGYTCSDTTPCDDNDVTKCPTGNNKASSKVGPGGWRGKVGLLGVAGTSSDFRNVCFQEEIASSPASLDTARNYYSLRNNINEGINKPYSCHDFLIIDGQSTGSKIHDECVDQAETIAGFIPASKNIQRTITGAANLYDPVPDTSFCAGDTGTDYTITGTITGAANAPSVTATDGTTTVTCTPVTANAYTCSITTSASSVIISGIYNNQPNSCNVAVNSSQTTVTGCTIAFSTKPSYTINGHILAADADTANVVTLEAQDGTETIPCTNHKDFSNTYSTYTCSIQTESSSLNIHATVPTGYTVTPDFQLSLPAGGGTVEVNSDNDVAVAKVATFTISGTISKGSNTDVSNLNTVTITPQSGSCTHTLPTCNGKNCKPWPALDTNNTGSYTCTVPGGSNALTIATDPTCSEHKDKGNTIKKKYTLSNGTTSSTGQELVIDLGNVNSSQTHNITITESTTDCSQ